MPPVVRSLDMHDAMDGGANLRIGLFRPQHGRAAHEQGAQPEQRPFRAAGVNGGKRPAMSGVHSVQQDTGFGSANLIEDDSVGTMPQRRFQQVVEGDRLPVRIGLGLFRDNMRLAKMQLGGVLNNKDAFLLRDSIGQDIEQCRFAGPRSA